MAPSAATPVTYATLEAGEAMSPALPSHRAVAVVQAAAVSVLDISMNSFISSIPSDIGQLTSVEFLDISYNVLTGTIPSSIVYLTLLKKIKSSVKCIG